MSAAADVPSISSSQLGARARNLHASPTSDVYVATLDGAQVVVKRTKITTANDLPRFEKELDLLHACAGHARMSSSNWRISSDAPLPPSADFAALVAACSAACSGLQRGPSPWTG